MRDTLILIPHDVLGLPVFGWGWALAAWLVVAIGLSVIQGRRSGWNAETWGSLPLFLAIAAAIVFFLPRLEEYDPVGERIVGLPIRGFGVMVTLGVICGVALAAYAARREGLDPELIYSLAFWMFLGGIGGARLFYVVQYWNEYRRESLGATLIEVFKFTQGGLVLYGGLLGGVGAALVWLRVKRLPILVVADLIAPSMVVGLAWGRIGCFLHGCCYGGLCAASAWGVTFPAYSPPYEHQQSEGLFHGLRLTRDSAAQGWKVREVDPEGPAARHGVEVGDVVRAINGEDWEKFAGQRVPARLFGPRLELRLADGREVTWLIDEFPARSRPVYPVQLYSSLHAALLAYLLWVIFPWRRKDGEVIAWLLTLYPVGRIFEELIRDDEPGRFGTSLTISQWVSVAILLVAAGLWAVVWRRPVRAAASSNP